MAATVDDQEATWPTSPLPWLRRLITIVGPTTLLTALLFYVGYVGTRARFEYFGVYLTMVDLSNQELLLAGLEIVYVAALLICLAVLIVVGAHSAVWWLLFSGMRGRTWFVAGLIAMVGLLLLGRALVGILVPSVAETENPPGQTSLALALGPALIAYSMWIAVKLVRDPPSGSAGSSTFTRWFATPTVRMLCRTGVITVLSIFLVGMFSATNSFAWSFGMSRAYENALDLRKKPEVVIDVRERLQNLPPGVTEIGLSPTGDQSFRYRYRGLRLLIEAGGKLFLIPEPWTRSGRTIIVPYDDDVRIQLVPAPTIYEPPSADSVIRPASE